MIVFCFQTPFSSSSYFGTLLLCLDEIKIMLAVQKKAAGKAGENYVIATNKRRCQLVID